MQKEFSAISAAVVFHRNEILEIVEKHGCSNPRLFGSVARGEATEFSDIDILVDVNEKTSLFDLGALYGELSRLLKVKIDLVISDQIPERSREQILAEAVPV